MAAIYPEDNEHKRRAKRKANEKWRIMDAETRALRPRTRSSIDAKKAGIETVQKQARDHVDYDGKQGNAAFFAGGELRIRYKNGHEKYEYHMGFAGRARTAGEMNSGEGVNDSGLVFC